ncbi:TAXI family TRAP transporter solute-binding subunit [Sporosarcina sp. Marseille-Q4063]|uniref:TAXI family TRAP transporter solute-binding subunit n=1 Tax=Sporosarcina sp. Marseille-Q4063 TaxID=2810514 RepID=UPI001BAEECF8|nr:TAXI family TRAP transporter solute-binding subunit [Sporosarcina sp. Marseille-Q4063]QUW21347.1 TAXI family TRAP transporter solute-binding subunit [Sporosarcina sp. Marseille-Q4063]
MIKKKKKNIALLLALVVALSITTACSEDNTNVQSSSNAEGVKELVLTTQTVGTAVYSRASAFNEILKPILPEDYSMEVQPSSTGGAATVLLLEENKAQIGTSNNVPAKKLFEGTYDDNRPAVKNVASILGGTDFTYMTIMFTDSFVQKTGIKTFEEIIEQKYPVKIVTKQPGSFGITGAEDLLDTMDVKFEDIKSWGGDVFHIDPSQMVDMLKEGKADISIDVVSLGQPAFSELTMTTPMHVIEISKETRDKLNDYGYANKVMPAESWNGQDNDIQTVVGTESLVVRKDVPDEVVYAITKAICENTSRLVELVPVMKDFDPKSAGNIEYLGIPLHPGAEKYFKEVGYLQ